MLIRFVWGVVGEFAQFFGFNYPVPLVGLLKPWVMNYPNDNCTMGNTIIVVLRIAIATCECYARQISPTGRLIKECDL